MFRGGRFRDARNRKLLDGIVPKLAGIDAGELTTVGVFGLIDVKLKRSQEVIIHKRN
jgi:hypothetical protein